MPSLSTGSLVAGALLALASSLTPSIATAQNDVFAYRNGDGEWAWVDASAVNVVRPKSDTDADETDDILAVFFVDQIDSTGVGFDDPELGAARRETIHEVIHYLGTVLDVPGRAELLVMASQTDGNGALASAGPFLLPELGFQGGFVFDHLTTGVDPEDEALDGSVTVDFGYTWYTGDAPPPADEYDLFTVLLHEITHALGFFSVAAANGRSALLNEDGRGLFSIYDSLLQRQGEPIYVDGGLIVADQTDLSSNDLVFAGPLAESVFGVPPRVFAPAPFQRGSSIGHWSFSTGFDPVMLPALSQGDGRRQYTTWELQALSDLGYALRDCEDCTVESEPPDPMAPDAGVPDQFAPGLPAPDFGPGPPPDGSPGVVPAGGGGCSVGDRSPGPLWAGLGLLAFALLRTRSRRRAS